MKGRPAITLLLPLLIGNAAGPHGNPVRDLGQAATDVGNIFGRGGSDGLVLYALVLGSFFSFLVALVLLIVVFRYLARSQKTNAEAFAAKDALNAAQTKLFVESMDRTAAAVGALAVSVSNGLQADAATAAELSRMRETDNRIISLLEQLARVA